MPQRLRKIKQEVAAGADAPAEQTVSCSGMSALGGIAKKKRSKKKRRIGGMSADEQAAIVPRLNEKGAKLRACLRCKLVKTLDQFENNGCNNCNWDGADWPEETSQEFNGMIAIMEPRDSWVAKWQRCTELKPGVYAKTVKGVPDLGL